MSDLISVNENPVSLFQKDKLEPFLAKVKKAVDDFKKASEVETTKGRKAVASFAYKIAQTSVLIDKAGKKLNEEKRAAINLVDKDRRRSKTFLKGEQDRARGSLTEWEEAEKRLIEEEALRMEFEADHTEALAEDDLFNRQREVERKEVELAKMLEERRIEEAAARIEKEKFEREELLKKEAATQAKKAAEEKMDQERQEFIRKEQAAKDAAIQAARAKIVAEERAKAQKAQAVRDALLKAEAEAKTEKEKAERKAAEAKAKADRKAAHHKHRKKVESEAIQGFINAVNCAKTDAENLVIAIKNNKIKNVTLLY